MTQHQPIDTYGPMTTNQKISHHNLSLDNSLINPHFDHWHLDSIDYLIDGLDGTYGKEAHYKANELAQMFVQWLDNQPFHGTSNSEIQERIHSAHLEYESRK